MSVNGTHVEAKLCTFTLDCTFVQVPHLYHDDASAKFSTNIHETDYCVVHNCRQEGTYTEYAHCHITVATPLPLFGIRSRPSPALLEIVGANQPVFFSSLQYMIENHKNSKYFLQSPVH